MGETPGTGIPAPDRATPPVGADDHKAPGILPCASWATTPATDLCPTIVCTGLNALPAGSTDLTSWPPCLASSSTM